MIEIAIIFRDGGEVMITLPAVPRVGEFINLTRSKHDGGYEVVAVIWEPNTHGARVTLRVRPSE